MLKKKKEKIEFIKNNLDKDYDFLMEKTKLSKTTIDRYKRDYLNIKIRIKWSKKEIDFLKENYPIHGALFCSEKLNRSIYCIHQKVNRLNIKHKTYIRYEKRKCPEGYHYCWKCKQELSEEKFYLRRPKSGDKKLTHICKACYLERHKRKYTTVNNTKELYRQNPSKYLCSNIKSRAKRKNIPFSLKEEDIIIPEYCPVLGIKIIVGSSSDNSPTVDRLIPSLGYTKENIRVISKRANTIKNSATKDEIYKIYKWMKKEGL
jgi:hypothetical protein